MKQFNLLIFFLANLFYACSQTNTADTMTSDSQNGEFRKIIKSNEEWKKELDAQTYHITREKGTEAAFTGKYNHFDENGVYHCSNCGNPLFKSENKYDSGSGWPSFYTVYSENSIEEKRDVSFGMIRTEVVCKKCGAHLGHVFDDGPQPTGLRYCVNSLSMEFEKKDEK